ncbi:MAG TPA: metalloregulator ArsR/SmtB family transcription factor [Mycobacteriales bacterium]|nr:metalloregulator ArsR/SmtB family transcription factor [Mycobacteriales bacterium]
MSKQPSNPLGVADQVACCAPLGIEPMSREQADHVAGLMKALSDPVRLRLMSMIAAADEVCVCDLMTPFDVSQPTISHHLKVLKSVGLVDSERRGTWVYYRAERAALEAIGGLFSRALESV